MKYENNAAELIKIEGELIKIGVERQTEFENRLLY